MIPVISPNYFMQKASYMQAKLIADTIITWSQNAVTDFEVSWFEGIEVHD